MNRDAAIFGDPAEAADENCDLTGVLIQMQLWVAEK